MRINIYRQRNKKKHGDECHNGEHRRARPTSATMRTVNIEKVTAKTHDQKSVLVVAEATAITRTDPPSQNPVLVVAERAESTDHHGQWPVLVVVERAESTDHHGQWPVLVVATWTRAIAGATRLITGWNQGESEEIQKTSTVTRTCTT